MKKFNIDDIRGGEVLGNSISVSKYQILLTEGTILKKEYIENLKELGVTEVYIQEENIKSNNQETEDKNIEIGLRCKTQVKNILERHIYQKNTDLIKLNDTATFIIDNILQEDSITDKLLEIKERNTDLYEHSLNCCVLSIILGIRLNLSNETIHAVGVGCLLHDMGLRFIAVDYNNININRLSGSKQQEYKKHPVYGYSSIEKETWLDPVSKNIILSHHERLDGSGFPFHKKRMSKEVCMMCICDTFDEMICGIGCERKKVYEAIEYIKSFKNTKFDGTIVDEFLKTIAAYPVGSYVLTNTGEIGVVVKQNNNFPDRPVIRIIHDDGMRVYSSSDLDLLKEKSVFIQDAID